MDHFDLYLLVVKKKKFDKILFFKDEIKMGCTTSVPTDNGIELLNQIARDLKDPKYNDLTQICPECYLTGILYRNINPASKFTQLYYCNCCQLNLCHFHYNKHEIKLPIRYD